jgi:hypothetical protein
VGVGEAVAEGRTVATKAAMERVLAKENILMAIIDGWKWCEDSRSRSRV